MVNAIALLEVIGCHTHTYRLIACARCTFIQRGFRHCCGWGQQKVSAPAKVLPSTWPARSGTQVREQARTSWVTGRVGDEAVQCTTTLQEPIPPPLWLLLSQA